MSNLNLVVVVVVIMLFVNYYSNFKMFSIASKCEPEKIKELSNLVEKFPKIDKEISMILKHIVSSLKSKLTDIMNW